MAKKIKTHYDDGGDVSFDTSDPSVDPSIFGGPTNSGAPTASDISGLTGAGSGSTGVDSTASDGVNLPSSVSVNYPQDSSKVASAGSGALASALKALGLGGGNTSNTAVLGALTGLLQAYGTASNNKTKGTLPTLPVLPGSSSSAGYGPAGGYNFANYKNATSATPGVGYAPTAPTAPKPASSYYTYGQGPQQQQFQQVNGGAPITPLTQGMANGGHAVQKYDIGGMVNPIQRPVMPQQQPGALGAPMSGMPAPQPQLGTPPATATGGMGMPPRPQTPMQPRVPTPPTPQQQQPPQSVMSQRMNAARRPMFADGGIVNNFTPNTAQIPGPQMVQSQGIQQSGNSLQKILPGFHRGAAAAGHTPGLAGGGALSTANPGMGVSRHITGPGDGTSDSIPARLANGEYVIDAQAVSMLGNGDNSAGAKRLDEFRKNLRQHKGGQLAKGKMAPDAKPVEHYMGGQ